MSDDPAQAAAEFHFPPEFADCIAKVATNWSHLEYAINATIWEFADVRPALGACMTAQVGSMYGRLAPLLALMKLRQVPARLWKKVIKFAERVRAPARTAE